MAEITPEQGKGAVLAGQQSNNREGYTLPFTEQVVPYRGPDSARITGFEGTLGVEITPIDENSARVRTWDLDAIAELLEDVSIAVPVTIPRIDFPPVLRGVTVTFNEDTATGADSHPADQQSYIIYGTGSGSLSPTASAQGSAAVIPDIQPDIEESFNENVPGVEYTFFLPSGSTQADVLAKLTTLAGATVLAWPQFHPVAVTLTAQGQQVALNVKADTRVSGGGSLESGQGGFEYGSGYSRSNGLSTKTLRIPATLHAALTITSPTASQTVTVTADASTPIAFPGAPLEQPAIPNAISETATATGTVTPSNIDATDPADIPSNGLRMRSLTPGPRDIGNMVAFSAVVVDFANLTT